MLDLLISLQLDISERAFVVLLLVHYVYVGCSSVSVTDQQSTRRRKRDQSSILFSAEQEAIIDVIQKLPTKGSEETTTRKIRRPEKMLMDKRKENLTVCWVPGHAGITGNKKAD
jgi:tRNA U34 2-thiouridine synthase MnmA/TrmU